MLKRKYLILFTLVFATVALLAASDAMAFWNDPVYGLDWETTACKDSPDCFAPRSPYEDTVGDWTVRYLGIAEEIEVNGTKWFIHHYEIFTMQNGSETQSGLNLAAWLYPVCWGNSPQIQFSVGDLGYSEPANLKLESEAVGVPSGGFGRKIQKTSVIWGTPVGDVLDWKLAATTDKVVWSTVYVDARRTQGLGFRMPVPGCDLAPEPPCIPDVPQGSYSSRICESLNREAAGGISVSYYRDINTGCIDLTTVVYYSDDFEDEEWDCDGDPHYPSSPAAAASNWCAQPGTDGRCPSCQLERPVTSTGSVALAADVLEQLQTCYFCYDIYQGGYFVTTCIPYQSTVCY